MAVSIQNEGPKKLEQFKQICRRHRIKLTPQRILIYEELIDRHDHPSTDMLYQQIKQKFPTISFDTVHRTLLTFCHIGVADIVEGTGNPKRFDGTLEPHHHFQCIHCKKIIDVYHKAYEDLPIPQELQKRCQVTNYTVHLEGLCEECRQQQQESDT